MSRLEDVISSSIADLEVQAVLRCLAEREVKKERVREVLGEAMGNIEARGRICRTLLMSAEDYFIVRKYMRSNLEIETEATVLRTGKMATYYGVAIIVTKGFEDGVVGVPVIPEADGTLIVLKEVAL